MFSTFNTNNSLFARTDNNGTLSDFQIPNPPSGSWLGTPHRFRIDWTASSVVFSIDGNVVHTEPVAITSTMRPGVSDVNTDGTGVSVDWLLMTPYSSPCNFQSAVFDAGAPANWSTLSWNAISPASTALNLSYRTGNTAVPDGSWTTFTAVASSGGALAGTSRYLQYESDLSSSDLSQTPVLEDVTLAYVAGATQAPAITSTNATTFVVGNSGSFTVTATGTPTPSLSAVAESLPGGITFVDNGNRTGTLSGTPASGTAGQYSLTMVAHNSSGPDANQAFTLTINESPSITTQPASQTINAGQTATLTVSATGTPSVTYQWYQGANGDTTTPVGTHSSSFTTPALTVTTKYWVRVSNAAGHADSQTATITIAATASTSITSSLNPSTFGQSVTFTATVTPSDGGTPTGTVTFTDGSNVLGTVSLSSRQAALSTSSLGAGSHSIVASYGGDSTYPASASAPLTQTVRMASTTLSLASSINPSGYNQAVTFTASVTPQFGGSATGTVTFKDGANTLRTATVSGNQATITVNTLALGTHSITSVYSGDSNLTGSSSGIVSQVVKKTSTATTVTSSPNPAFVAQTITYTATVISKYLGLVSGSVVFKSGSASLGSAPLVNGRASVNASFSTSGNRSITTTYAGDANNTGSTSPVLTQVVNKYPSSTTVVSNLHPSRFGQAVMFTATVTTGGSPTGTVTFKSDGATLDTVAVTGNTASLSTSALTAGTHVITAIYSGDATYNASTSPVLKQVVSKAPTAESLTSSPNPSSSGQTVTFTATVTSSAGVPTGTVTFKKGATTLGPATLSGGVATFTTSTLPLGSSTITANYGGTTNYGTSSASETQLVH
jgi:hypothetical protein